MTHAKLNQETAWDFLAYADVADDVFDGRFLQELDQEYVACALRASQELDLPWPPGLGEAELFILQHGPQVKFLIDTTQGVDA